MSDLSALAPVSGTGPTGDSAPVDSTPSSYEGNVDSGNSNDSDNGDGDYSDTEEVSQALADEGDETNPDADPDPAPEAKESKKASFRARVEARINELAAEKGVDASDPKIRGILQDLATREERSKDTEAYVKQLEEKFDWDTPWEKEQRKAKQPAAESAKPEVPAEAKQPPSQQQPRTATTNPVRPFARVDQNTGAVLFGDEFDGKWQRPRDAYDQLSTTWQKIADAEDKGLGKEALDHYYQEIDQIQRGITRRHALELFPHFDQMIEQRVEERLARFRQESGLEEIVPVVKGTVKQNQARGVYEAVAKDIVSNPQLAPLFDQINQPPKDGSTVKLNGQSVPATLLNQALAADPELLEQLIELESDPNTPETVMRKQILRTYKLVMRRAHERQQSLQKDKALVKQATTAGQEQAKREAEKAAVRDSVTPSTHGRTPAPTRPGRSLANPSGPGLSIAAMGLR